jgi:hypothetical protein
MPGLYQTAPKDRTTASLKFDLVFWSVAGILGPLPLIPLFWPPHFTVVHLLLAAVILLWVSSVIIRQILPCAKELRRRKRENL